MCIFVRLVGLPKLSKVRDSLRLPPVWLPVAPWPGRVGPATLEKWDRTWTEIGLVGGDKLDTSRSWYSVHIVQCNPPMYILVA
jgi:hypothetical protein